MARTHLFVTVVLVAAAAVAGLLALTRNTQQGATATTAVDAQIAARSRALDRLEASLRRSLAKQMPALPATRAGSRQSPTPRTVYVQSSEAPVPAHVEHESEHGEDGNEHAYEHERGDD